MKAKRVKDPLSSKWPFEDEEVWAVIREDGRLAFFMEAALIFDDKESARERALADNARYPSKRTVGGDEFRDHLDQDIYEAIIDQCGSAEDSRSDWDGKEPIQEKEPWPALDLDGGCSWFDYKIPAVAINA